MENDDGWWALLALIQKIDSCERLDEFLRLFLTHEERASLKDRYVIVKELIKGEKSQREISADQNVSIAKITRGSNELKRFGEDIKVFLRNNF